MTTDISVVYPHKNAVIYDLSTFVMGRMSAPETVTKLTLNGSVVDVSALGCFVWPVKLHYGENNLTLIVHHKNGQEAQHVRHVHAMEPYATLTSSSKIWCRPETFLPAGEITLSPNTSVDVAVSALPNAEVSLEIDGVGVYPLQEKVEKTVSDHTGEWVDHRRMIFNEPHYVARKIPTKGYYAGVIPHSPSCEVDVKILFSTVTVVVKHQGQTKRTLLTPEQARLVVWREPKPAMILKDNPITRVSPHSSDRLTPQRVGTTGWVTRMQEGYARFITHACQTSPYWIQMDHLGLADKPYETRDCDSELFVLKEIVQAQTFAPEPYNSRYVLALSGKALLSLDARENGLHLILENTKNAIDTTQLHPAFLIDKKTTTDTRLGLFIKQPRLSGVEYQYDDQNNLHLVLDSLPETPSDVVVLLDAGHGGGENGSTSCTGLAEKTLNLKLTKQLENKLKSLGFKTAMTRTSDQFVGLADRQKKAKHTRAHIVLSVHHNALPDGRDPREHKGACTFWYHGMSEPLANAMQSSMTSMKDVNDYGTFYQNFALPRVLCSQSVLLEVGFFTSPQEFERVTTPEFQSQWVESVSQALLRYVTA